MTDEGLWEKHIEEYPQIKSWSAEKREGARKGFKSGLAEGRKELKKMETQDFPKCLTKQYFSLSRKICNVNCVHFI